jgi:hydroxymethylglutaryl-CoA reductase
MIMEQILNTNIDFNGFSKLSRKQRLESLKQMGVLNKDDYRFIESGAIIDPELADKFIENSLGYFQLPIGVAAHFVIDAKPYAIPMAVEETSIIAAASKSAKFIKDNGTITTEIIGDEIIGQIQIAKVTDYGKFFEVIENNKQNLIDSANKDVAHGLVSRGGGVTSINVRSIDRGDGSHMAVVHVYANTCEAMGANIINQVCEYLKPKIEALTNESVTMCILSNLVDSKVTRATVRIKNRDDEFIDKMVEGSLFAQLDPYRAATNNKGILNGIDPILIATGNDWRAVEAGAHAYAARKGQYSSLSRWYKEGKDLVGVLEAPIVLGTVGGMTRLHPFAKLSLKMMGIKSADELSRVCAAVGLAQNFGAIRALTTVGIIEGHMKLHIQNLTLGIGAKENEMPVLQKRLEEILKRTKRISLSHAKDVLREIRDKTKEMGKGSAVKQS